MSEAALKAGSGQPVPECGASGAAQQAAPPSAGPPPGQPEVEPRPEAKAPQPDFYDQLVRLKAEFENYRKRTDKEKPDYYRLGKADALLRFLPVYDLLVVAHDQIQATHADTEFAKGMDGIFKEFEKIFREEGVRHMDPAGKPFDPLQHEVLGTVEKDGFGEGVVVEVLQSGYMMHDKVLRAARVRIARKAAGPGEGEAT